MQLTAKRGMFEFDDMIHNILGAVAGIWLYALVKRCLFRRKSGV
ncbi:MAG TPA: hypothetical protein DF613_11290 [Lachnospiraceae bacterium]|nr:hypothetical protein [Lachnospiraceae bacterium]